MDVVFWESDSVGTARFSSFLNLEEVRQEGMVGGMHLCDRADEKKPSRLWNQLNPSDCLFNCSMLVGGDLMLYRFSSMRPCRISNSVFVLSGNTQSSRVSLS